MSQKHKKMILKRFPDIKFKKIILYKNPNEFCRIDIERVNPNHVGILWGQRKKKLNKGSHQIKFGKVYFECIPVVVGLGVVGWLDMFTGYMFNIIMSVGLLSLLFFTFFSILFYWSIIKLEGKHLCLVS